jgi:hypothetical protein
MFHFGGGACVDTDTGSSPKMSVTDTGSSPKMSVTDTGSSPKNVRDRHRLLPQKLVVLLYIDYQKNFCLFATY